MAHEHDHTHTKGLWHCLSPYPKGLEVLPPPGKFKSLSDFHSCKHTRGISGKHMTWVDDHFSSRSPTEQWPLNQFLLHFPKQKQLSFDKIHAYCKNKYRKGLYKETTRSCNLGTPSSCCGRDFCLWRTHSQAPSANLLVNGRPLAPWQWPHKTVMELKTSYHLEMPQPLRSNSISQLSVVMLVSKPIALLAA